MIAQEDYVVVRRLLKLGYTTSHIAREPGLDRKSVRTHLRRGTAPRRAKSPLLPRPAGGRGSGIPHPCVPPLGEEFRRARGGTLEAETVYRLILRGRVPAPAGPLLLRAVPQLSSPLQGTGGQDPVSNDPGLLCQSTEAVPPGAHRAAHNVVRLETSRYCKFP